MSDSIYFIGGSKGGVGKSMVAMALLHYLKEIGREVLLIDTDTSNPDVSKIYEQIVPTELLNLDEVDGWMQLVNLCVQNKDKIVVVNTAARNNLGVAAYGENLNGSLPELDRKLVTLWVINRQKDSLLLLQDFMQAIPNGLVHVIRNGYFGDERKFETFNASKIRKDVEGAGGKSVTFPDLADRVADLLYTGRASLEHGLKEFDLGERSELRRWVGATKTMFSQVVE